VLGVFGWGGFHLIKANKKGELNKISPPF